MKGYGKRGSLYQIKGRPFLKVVDRETTLEDIQELLHDAFRDMGDYKFAAVFKSRLADPTYFCIYELDNLLDEVCRYAGLKNVKAWVAQREKELAEKRGEKKN